MVLHTLGLSVRPHACHGGSKWEIIKRRVFNNGLNKDNVPTSRIYREDPAKGRSHVNVGLTPPPEKSSVANLNSVHGGREAVLCI